MSPASPPTHLVHWQDETQTLSHAQAWAACLRRLWLAQPNLHVLLCLQGDLGAGKTTWVRHLLRSLGVQGRIKSPSYAILETYSLLGDLQGCTVNHFDFYRISDPLEFEEAGLREQLLAPGLQLVEWPQQVGEQLPLADVRLLLQLQSNGHRDVHLWAQTQLGHALAQA